MPGSLWRCGGALVLAACLAPAAWGAGWERVEWNAPPAGKKKEPANVTAVGILDHDNAYAGLSDGRLLHWNGKRLRAVEHPGTGVPRKFVVNSSDDAWVFGDEALSLHYDGRRWSRVDNPLSRAGPSAGRLWGAGCAAPDRCFAGTRDGRLMEWDGRKWRETGSPAERARIYAMRFSSRDSGWMVGDGFLAGWDGRGWKRADLPDVPRLYDLAFTGDGRGWAVGDHGAFFEYDGKGWKKVAVRASFFRLRAVACASRTACWAVGEAGAAFRWGGSGWQRVRLGTFERLTAVAMRKGRAFIGGDRGTLFRRRQAPAAAP